MLNNIRMEEERQVKIFWNRKSQGKTKEIERLLRKAEK